MSLVSKSGLFRAPVLSTDGKKRFHAYFKPVEICITSAPPPIRHRLVSYQMLCWPKDQIPVEEDEVKRYVRSDGQRSFTFTAGLMPYTLETLLPLIRRHFATQVLQHKRVYSDDTAIARFNDRNTAEYSTPLPDGSRIEVSHVIHKSEVRLTKELDHVFGQSMLEFAGRRYDVHGELIYDGYHPQDRPRFLLEYNDHRTLLRDAVKFISDDDIDA